MFKGTTTGLAAALLLTGMSAQSAIVSGTFAVSDAQLPVLYSGTLDPACTPTGGGFFFCTAATITPTAVAIAPLAGGGGTIDLKYDDGTGEVTEITSMNMFVSDMGITISGALTGAITVVAGNNVPVPNDFPTVIAGTAGSNGSADADQNPGNITSFQHDAPGTESDATDFAAFTDIVDTCVGTACALIPVLAIDGLRYEIIGSVAGGVYNGTLRSETANNSNYIVNFQSAIVPVPAAVWLFGSALGLLGWVRRRAA
jgi:hypothetical protein